MILSNTILKFREVHSITILEFRVMFRVYE